MRDENLSYRSNEIFERNFTISVSLPFDLSVCIVIENTEKGIKYFIYIYIKKILSLATRKPRKIDRSINFLYTSQRFSIFFPKSIDRKLPPPKSRKEIGTQPRGRDHSTMVIIQRDFSLGGIHAEVSFAPRFLVHEGSTQSNFLLARRKVFRGEREREISLSNRRLLSSSFLR